jgi:hypothetical protein
LGTSPNRQLSGILKNADSKKGCPGKLGLTRKNIQQILGSFILSDTRILVPPVVAMLNRW